MRALIVSLLAGGLLLSGCDRHSTPASQATATADLANTVSPDEATAPATTPAGGVVDRGHKGAAAPTTAFKGPDGATMTLAAFKGKPVLVNLWATWCGPCVKEMPTLDRLAAAKGAALQVVTISQDMQPEKVLPFFQRTGVKALKPYRDPQMALSLGLGANLPTTILYDSTGHEVWRVAGDLDWTGPKAAALIAEAS